MGAQGWHGLMHDVVVLHAGLLASVVGAVAPDAGSLPLSALGELSSLITSAARVALAGCGRDGDGAPTIY